MEKKLKQLFDFQKFEQNPRLSAIIDEAENSPLQKLTDDDLSLVSAAGTGRHKHKKYDDMKK